MSALIVEVLGFMLLFGLIARAGIWLACRVRPRLASWSGLWAVALVCTIVAPVLRVWPALLPDFAVLPLPVDLMPILPLDALDIPALRNGVTSEGVSRWSVDAVATGLIVLYLLGTGLALVRLARGRRHVRRIIETADPVARYDGIAVCTSSDTVFAFAWSPLRLTARRPARRQPVILIPELYHRSLDDRQLEFILRHEAAHIRRRDDEIGLLLRIVLCFAWFSPFAHSLFAGWSQSAELQSDRAVTDGRTHQMRRAYAETLLTALHIMADRVRQYPAAAFSTPDPEKKA